MPAASSLSRRLVAGALVWLALMLAIGGGVLSMAFRHTVEQEFTHRLDALLRAMIASTKFSPEGEVSFVHPLGDPRFDQVLSGWYWEVTETSGHQVRSRSLWDGSIDVGEGQADLQTRHITGPKNEPLLVVERDLRLPGSDGWVHLLIAADLNEVKDGVRQFDLLLLTALGLMGLGLVMAIFIQVRFGLRPLRAMALDLESVRHGDRPRLPDTYPLEVAPLAQAMNSVLDKDAEMIERARTHVGNLAHGLKTPLAVMAASPDKNTAHEQLEIMRRLIEYHLARASAVAGAGRVLGIKVPVREVVENVLSALQRIFGDKPLTFDIRVPEDVVFRGHREDLEEILGNLLENACKWTRGMIRVTAHQEGQSFELTVEDDGPGMPEDLAIKASVRGKRFDELVPGWGLGLAIVSDLVEVNGGALSFSHSDLGGLQVTVKLPHKP